MDGSKARNRLFSATSPNPTKDITSKDLAQTFCAGRGVPIAAVKRRYCGLKLAGIIKAGQMHAPTVRMRLWLVETLHPAYAAEHMVRFPAAKSVGGEVILAGQEREALMRDEQVQIAARRADRAIAVEQVWARIAPRLEADRAAMAATRDPDELAHSTVTDLARLRG